MESAAGALIQGVRSDRLNQFIHFGIRTAVGPVPGACQWRAVPIECDQRGQDRTDADGEDR